MGSESTPSAEGDPDAPDGAIGSAAAHRQRRDEEDLSAYNEETMSKYGFPQVNPPDAHVYKDEDGYYVVKEEWRKPTNPFERLKLAKPGRRARARRRKRRAEVVTRRSSRD